MGVIVPSDSSGGGGELRRVNNTHSFINSFFLPFRRLFTKRSIDLAQGHTHGSPSGDQTRDSFLIINQTEVANHYYPTPRSRYFLHYCSSNTISKSHSR